MTNTNEGSTMNRLRRVLVSLLMCLSIAIGVHIALPVSGGVYYSLCGKHIEEQEFLDKCIIHLELCRAYCDDDDLCGVLDYTIRRYGKVGAWDVMFMPLIDISPPGYHVVGCNAPWVPGITLDTCTLRWTPAEAAMVVAHEAMHDYYPYLGHAHITPREHKLWKVSAEVQRQLGSGR